MLGDNPAVLSDHDLVGVGVNLDWASDRAGAHRVFIVVETDEAGLRHRGRQGVEAVEPAAIGNESRPLFLEDLPDRSIRPFGMGMGLRKDQTSVEQPGVELIIAFEAGLGMKNRSRTSPTWFSTCPFSHPDAGVQATGSTR